MESFIISCFVILTASLTAADDSSCTLTGNSIANVNVTKTNCTEIIIKDLIIPKGEMLDLTNLLDGTTVTFEGNTTLGYEEWVGPVITVGGNNIKITGSSDHIIDGQGSLWWDGIGGNGGKDKPVFLYTMELYNSVFENLNFLNTPVHCIYIFNSTNVTFTNINIDILDGDYECLGHNTDGFNVFNSEKIYFRNITVYNQDDCLAIKSGKDIYFEDAYCHGGHGVSIGSVGGRYNNVVENVFIRNCYIVNSENGVRIKTNYNTTGLVTGVTYKDIILDNITDYGILVRTDYENLGPTGIPTGGVPITNFTLYNVSGTVQPDGTNIWIFALNTSNWNWTEINLTGGTVYKTCVGVPEGSGISCGSSETSNANVNKLHLLVLFISLGTFAFLSVR